MTKKTAFILGSADKLLDLLADPVGMPSHYSSHPVALYPLRSQSDFICLFRHGVEHKVAPHLVNYRANLDALIKAGVQEVISFNIVGGIAKDCLPGTWHCPNQIIDYTHGRISSFYEERFELAAHIDFTNPFDESLQKKVAASLGDMNGRAANILSSAKSIVYGCTQGPRLETRAEIQRMQQDGCDMVGMTLMPEAALAREKNLAYASLCFVVNQAAGLGEPLDMQKIQNYLDRASVDIQAFIQRYINSH